MENLLKSYWNFVKFLGIFYGNFIEQMIQVNKAKLH